MKTFLFLFLSTILFRIDFSLAQQDSISDEYVEAVTFFNQEFGDPRYWTIIETKTDFSGVKNQTEYAFHGGIVENEFLILKVSREGKFFDLLLNLQDSLTQLEKLNTLNKKVFYYPLQYKNLIIYYQHWFGSAGNIGVYRTQENYWNKLFIENFYKYFKVLKSNLKAEEFGDVKLAEFKKSAQSNSSIQITEEQRKYIVQANAANDNKDYMSALQLYRKALDVNLYSYPAAYFNMALILAETNNFYQATYAMKAYLILSPNASDARAAQDKIYEWELYIIEPK